MDFPSFDTTQALLELRKAKTDIQDIEVKSAKKGLPKDIVESLSAFANGSGGVLICGVSEEDGFVPVEDFDVRGIQDALADACANKLVPPLRPEIYPTQFEGATILVAQVPEVPSRSKPCYIASRGMYSGSFIRTGDGDRKLSSYEIDRLIEERVQPRHDIFVVEEASVDDLDQNAVSLLLQRERSLYPNIFGKFNDTDALINLRVISEGGDGKLHPTIAGLMALAVYPQKYFPRLNVSFAVYPGLTKASIESGQKFLDSSEIIGSIPIMVTEAVSSVKKNMRTGSIIEDAFRKDVPDYPLIAVREAIANALMHRDYSPESWGTQVQVNLYPDRLEILSSGGLYGDITVDSLGMQGVSSTRNEFLSKLLMSTSYEQSLGGAHYVVENKGTGYIEIEAQLKNAGMEPPAPRSTPGLFSLTFYKKTQSPVAGYQEFSGDVKETILSMVKVSGSVSAREVEEASGRSRGTVLSYINALIEEGKLESTEPGSRRNKRYRLIEP